MGCNSFSCLVEYFRQKKLVIDGGDFSQLEPFTVLIKLFINVFFYISSLASVSHVERVIVSHREHHYLSYDDNQALLKHYNPDNKRDKTVAIGYSQ